MLNLCNKNNTAMENLQIINAKIASVLGKVRKYLLSGKRYGDC